MTKPEQYSFEERSSSLRLHRRRIKARMHFIQAPLAPRGTSGARAGERGNPTKTSYSLRPTTIGLTHSLCRCAASAPNRPTACAAEKIRDVGDNVPPRWEGCCHQRPIIFLRDARTNNFSSFVGGEGEDRSVRMPISVIQ